MVACSGRSANMERALHSLLEQDYPGLLVCLATHGRDDPAHALVAELARRYPQARHIEAGKAERCGQKNKNLLDCLASLGPEIELYVFCDANHTAPPDLVRRLLAPIIAGEARFTTGYRFSRLHGCGPATIAFHLVNRLLLLVMSTPFLTQPWGGAMAAEARAFHALGVPDLWRRTVVDDCSLAGLLASKRVGVRFCTDALVASSARDVDKKRLDAWLFRQLLYPKLYTFAAWLGIGAALAAFTLTICLSLLFLIHSAAAPLPAVCVRAAALGHLAGLGLCQELLRRRLAEQCRPRLWLKGLCLTVWALCGNYRRCITARSMDWRGWRYDFDGRGRVTKIVKIPEEGTESW